MAEEAASFRISIDSTSLKLIDVNGFITAPDWFRASVVNGIPSTTKRGWFVAVIDEDPLILIFVVPVDLPLTDSINTPAVFPWRACSIVGTGIFLSISPSTLAILPVTFD